MSHYTEHDRRALERASRARHAANLQRHLPRSVQSLNDDDFYIVDHRTATALREIPVGSSEAHTIRTVGILLRPGQICVTGLQARMRGLVS